MNNKELAEKLLTGDVDTVTSVIEMLIEYMEKTKALEAEIKALKAKLSKGVEAAFKAGYELGHDNTVESNYCGGEQAWEDYGDDFKKEQSLESNQPVNGVVVPRELSEENLEFLLDAYKEEVGYYPNSSIKEIYKVLIKHFTKDGG